MNDETMREDVPEALRKWEADYADKYLAPYSREDVKRILHDWRESVKNTRAQASAPEGGETVPYCKKCGDGIVASDPGICGTCYDTDHVAAPDFFAVAEATWEHWVACALRSWAPDDLSPIDREFVAHVASEIRQLHARSNAKAGEVDSKRCRGGCNEACTGECAPYIVDGD